MIMLILQTEIILFQSLNNREGNLKVRLLIKSSYYIVPNPSTTLILGMSPLYSRSPSSSPSRSGSPVPSYHASYLSSAGSSPISDPEDRYLQSYTHSFIFEYFVNLVQNNFVK